MRLPLFLWVATCLTGLGACGRVEGLLHRFATTDSVEVSPSSATVPAGQQVQLTAVDMDGRGTPLGGSVDWTSSDSALASVDDSGLVTTRATGAVTITATSDGVAGASQLSVRSDSIRATREPTGLILINEQPWNCVACNGWKYRAEHGSADIQPDSSAPASSGNALRVVFPKLMPRDNGPGNHWLVLPRPHRWRELYVAYWIKWGPPWDALHQGAKVSFFWTESGSYLYAIQVPGAPPYHIGMVVGWPPYGYAYGDRGVWHPNVATTAVVAGEWYFVEEYVRYPTQPGASDGVIRWWVNGTLNGDYADVSYPTDRGFVQVEFPFTRQESPRDRSYVYLDHVRVSGRP